MIQCENAKDCLAQSDINFPNLLFSQLHTFALPQLIQTTYAANTYQAKVE